MGGAAIVNAVADTERAESIRHLDMPLKPERIWRAIRDARADAETRGI